MAGMLTLKPSSNDDLKVSLELGGQAITFYLDPSKIDGNEQTIQNELLCGLCCTKKKGFAACVALCIATGKCCDGGIPGQNCDDIY